MTSKNILIILLSVVIVATIGVSIFIFSTKYTPFQGSFVGQEDKSTDLSPLTYEWASVTPSPNQQNFIYTNKFYGFQVTYPMNWYKYSFSAGNYTFESYNGLEKTSDTALSQYRDFWYIPTTGQAKINIYAVPTKEDSFHIKFVAEHPISDVKYTIIKEAPGPLIGNISSIETERTYPPVRVKNIQLPAEAKHHDIQYKVIKGNYTYYITLEPAESKNLPEVQALLQSIQFSPKTDFVEEHPVTSPSISTYQDILKGFYFEYPSKLDLGLDSQDVYNTNNIDHKTGIGFKLWDFENEKNTDFATLIKENLASLFSYDGEQGSIYVDPNSIKIENYVNSNGVKGVRVHGKKIIEGGEIPITTDAEFIVYPLNIPIYNAIIFNNFNSDIPSDSVQEMLKIANSFKYLNLKENTN